MYGAWPEEMVIAISPDKFEHNGLIAVPDTVGFEFTIISTVSIPTHTLFVDVTMYCPDTEGTNATPFCTPPDQE